LAGLDSLASAHLRRALDYLQVEDGELGFDKLYADDDTFRLEIVETILNDPLQLFAWQSATTAEARQAASRPRDLLPFLARLVEAPADGHTASAATTTARTLDEAVSSFIERCRAAERELDRAFSGLTPRQKEMLLILAPAIWGDAEYPDDRVRKGELHREVGQAADTTLELSEDPFLDAAVALDRPALSRAASGFAAAVLDLATAAESLAPTFGSTDPTGPGPDTIVSAPDATISPPGATLPPAGAAVAFPGATGQLTAVLETPWGPLLVGGAGSNTYDSRCLAAAAFIIEPGGDDVYRGRVASAAGGLVRPFSAVIDVAGNDLYDAGGRSYCLGGALLGLAALVDFDGDDSYRGGGDGTLGAGCFGAGLLMDGGGADIFEGRNLCQGAGAFGLGALISLAAPVAPPGPEIETDRAFDLGLVKVPGTGAVPIRHDDNDTYLCARQSQGFASTYGAGLLFDQAGNDVYRAGGHYLHRPLLPHDFQSLSQGFSIGFRPRAAGGIGLLLDEQGNDFYDAEVYAQGASYWYSIGLLADFMGNDRYIATQYAQGAGVHLAVGSLWDRGGDDHYVAKFGVTQGTAHDLSVSLLLEEGGNDYYTVSDGQGISITNSTAIFIDQQGDDQYATPGTGQGALTWARGFCGPGIFLDLEGKDTYPRDEPARDAAVWSSGAYALGIDLDRDVRLPDEQIPDPVLTAADSARGIAELFDEASLWEVGSARERVRRARAALLSKGWPAAQYAIDEKLDSQDGLVYRTLLELGKAHPDSFAARLIPRLRDPDIWVQRNVISLLGEMKRTEARRAIESMLADRGEERHWPRLIQALGHIGDREAAAAVRPFLQSGQERRRLAAVVALGALHDTVSVPAIAARLDDPLLTVRSAASSALTGFGAAAIPALLAIPAGAPVQTPRATTDRMPAEVPRAIAIRTVGHVAAAIADSARADELRARGRARGWLLDLLRTMPDDAAARAAVVEALLRFKDEETRRTVAAHMHDEPDPFVRRTYEWGIR